MASVSPGVDVEAAAGSSVAPQITPQVNPDGYTSARVCGGCHTDIYNSWKNSLHAFSLTDPVFDTSFMQALKIGGEEARRRCLQCHAPMTIMNGDYGLELGVTREGVSCDFCHTVTAVHLDGREKPYDLSPGFTKRGVIKRAASPAHDVAYSELHGTSEFCGGCHNFVTPDGVALMSTYDEWLAGPYSAEGVQCQDCHMVLSAGNVVTEDVQPSAAQIHLHSLIHDTEQLKGAVSVEIDNAEWRQNTVTVEVLVENIGSGHMVPTGIPTREVVLTVQANGQGGYVWTGERHYRRLIGDETGLPLQTDHEALLNGALIISDSRLAPREPRRERFVFEIPNRETVKITATVVYRYAPSILRVQPMNIELTKTERYVVRPPSEPPEDSDNR
jgi:ssDNA-binding Zn-finger/Zn-ribbon topoisomerase 1